jgi:hypothetical protein
VAVALTSSIREHENKMNVFLGRQYLERQWVARFLKGHNSRFKVRRDTMCQLPSLLSLNEVIASIEQQEITLKAMMDEVTPVVRSALTIPTIPIREDHKCYNYGKKMIS